MGSAIMFCSEVMQAQKPDPWWVGDEGGPIREKPTTMMLFRPNNLELLLD